MTVRTKRSTLIGILGVVALAAGAVALTASRSHAFPYPLPPQPDGACQLPDGTCQVMPGTFCRAFGGVFDGPGTDCD